MCCPQKYHRLAQDLKKMFTFNLYFCLSVTNSQCSRFLLLTHLYMSSQKVGADVTSTDRLSVQFQPSKICWIITVSRLSRNDFIKSKFYIICFIWHLACSATIGFKGGTYNTIPFYLSNLESKAKQTSSAPLWMTIASGEAKAASSCYFAEQFWKKKNNIKWLISAGQIIARQSWLLQVWSKHYNV